MRAVILAGGRGQRLAPYTTIIPKPLLPLGDRPILDVIIHQLAAAGIDHLTLTLGYMSDYFKVFLSQRPALHKLMKIDFIEEHEPTGTAGSLAFVPHLDEPFLVMNGDILTDLNYAALINQHVTSDAWLTIATYRKPVKIDLGVIESNSAGCVTDYIEKPTLNYDVSMGIYIYSPEVLGYIVKGKYLDFPTLVLRLRDAGKPVMTYRSDCTWLDLGRPEDLLAATELFIDKQEQYLPKVA